MAVTVQELQDHFRHVLACDALSVTNLRSFARGISRETWFLDCLRSPHGEPEPLILRRDPPGNAIDPRPLRFEYEVYRRLQGSGVPVAATLWWQDSTAGLAEGRDFYVRRQVEGSWEVPQFFDPDPAHDELRVQICCEHVRKLAIVHGCDWGALGFGELLAVPANAAQCAPLAIERHYAELARFQFSPLPVLTATRHWLEANAPIARRISLLKGTNGLGEEVFRDGRIVALSDWEQCSIGDPASDFARTQNLMDPIVRDGRTMWDLSKALDYYFELTGVRVPIESVMYYRVLTAVENVVNLHHGVLPIASGADLSVRLSWLATEPIHIAERLMMDAIQGRLGVGTPQMGSLPFVSRSA